MKDKKLNLPTLLRHNQIKEEKKNFKETVDDVS